MSQPTVKVSTARPADWAVRKSEAMHTALAAGADIKAARHAEKMAAKAEKSARRAAA